jgi:hypothetical protein
MPTGGMQLDMLERLSVDPAAHAPSASAAAGNAAPAWNEDVDHGGDERMQVSQIDDVSSEHPGHRVCTISARNTSIEYSFQCSCFCTIATTNNVKSSA